MNLPSEGGFRNIFSNEIAVSFPLNVYEKIGTTTRGKGMFYPTSFSLKAISGYSLEVTTIPPKDGSLPAWILLDNN